MLVRKEMVGQGTHGHDGTITEFTYRPKIIENCGYKNMD